MEFAKPFDQGMPHVMNRQETIDAIMKLNPSATTEFLESFADDELTRYLARLNERSRQARDEGGRRRHAIFGAQPRATVGAVV